MKPRALVLTGYGINCDLETQHAFAAAGAEAVRVHLGDLMARKDSLENYHVLAFPGGFSFGDDIASGKVLANKFKFNLAEDLQRFIEAGKLVIGICNGFQAMVKMGVLPGFERNYRLQLTTLTFNDSGRFEDRWVYLKINQDSRCVFTKGIESLYLPVRHGEGKFVAANGVIQKLESNNQIVAQYVDADGKTASYPWNPNGSMNNIAGICDETGRVYGMMPHPEAFNSPVNHPRWTRGEVKADGLGIRVFKNAVEFASNHLV